MSYPQAYIDYLVYFHGARDYFECHEVLEEHWKDEGMDNAVWVGLIQVAVALYHHRRENYSGAHKMMQSAIENLKSESLEAVSIDHTALLKLLECVLVRCEQKAPFLDINFPLTDVELERVCQQLCVAQGYVWGKNSDLNNRLLVDKHRLRDRSDVIMEREKQKQIRIQKKS